MSVGQQLIAEIKKHAGHTGPAVKTIAVSAAAGVDLVADAAAIDSLSSSIREIRMRVPALANADAATLKKWADGLCGRITYLLEHLGPLEIDSEAGQALIRSTIPDTRNSATGYYEVLLQSQGGGLFSLRRYRRQPSPPAAGPRDQVDFTVTHDQLEKLADDLVDTIP